MIRNCFLTELETKNSAFLAHLLALSFLASRPCFYLMTIVLVDLFISLLIDVAINKMKTTNSKVAAGFSGRFL